MLKLRTVWFAVIAPCILLVLSSMANAQYALQPGELQQYTDNPCSSPYISLVLKDEAKRKGVTSTLAGGADCDSRNYSHYGSWRSYDQLWSDLQLYRHQEQMNSNGIVLRGSVRGNDGHTIFLFKKDSAYVGVDAGLIKENTSCCWFEPETVIAADSGKFVPVSAVIAAGGDKQFPEIVSAGNTMVTSQGEGRFTNEPASGHTLFQFPGRYAIVSAKPPAARRGGKPNPSDQETADWRRKGPCSDPWVSKALTEVKGSIYINGYASQGDCNPGIYNGGSWSNYDQLYRAVAARFSNQSQRPVGGNEDYVLLCLSGTVNQIRGMENGVNHITVKVSGVTAYFSGNVLRDMEKNWLSLAAFTCGAEKVENNLRVGQ